MTLIVALRTEDGKIIIGADGLVYVNDQANNLNPTFPTNKLLSVRRTDWKLAYAGSNVVEAFSKRIEAEVELGQRSPFDPHLEIGGPAYLNALNILASEAEDGARSEDAYHHGAVGRIRYRQKPVFAPKPAPARRILHAAGRICRAWCSGCHCLVVAPCARPLLRDKRGRRELVSFTIWQAAKHDLRIGSPEAGFPISLCVMEADKPNLYEPFTNSDVYGWVRDWQEQLQRCFMATINSMPRRTPA